MGMMSTVYTGANDEDFPLACAYMVSILIVVICSLRSIFTEKENAKTSFPLPQSTAHHVEDGANNHGYLYNGSIKKHPIQCSDKPREETKDDDAIDTKKDVEKEIMHLEGAIESKTKETKDEFNQDCGNCYGGDEALGRASVIVGREEAKRRVLSAWKNVFSKATGREFEQVSDHVTSDLDQELHLSKEEIQSIVQQHAKEAEATAKQLMGFWQKNSNTIRLSQIQAVVLDCKEHDLYRHLLEANKLKRSHNSD